MLLVDLVNIQVDPGTGAAMLVLREHEPPNRLLPIIVGGAEASSIALAASGRTAERPMTHDLIATLVESLDAHVDAAEVTELHDGSFRAALSLSGPMGERRVDTRPSDAIAIALRLNAPLYVSEHVLDEAGSLPIGGLDRASVDEASLDAEVDQFRDFLAELDPADFSTELPLPTGPAFDGPEADFHRAPNRNMGDSGTGSQGWPAPRAA
jgi:bifunctional DNase/RNase